MQANVTNRASRKLMTVCNRPVLNMPASTFSKNAKETIKTNNGSRKARITLSVTDGPGDSPICS